MIRGFTYFLLFVLLVSVVWCVLLGFCLWFCFVVLSLSACPEKNMLVECLCSYVSFRANGLVTNIFNLAFI